MTDRARAGAGSGCPPSARSRPCGSPSGDREALSESFRYNLATSSAVVPAGLRPGDVYTFTAVVPATS